MAEQRERYRPHYKFQALCTTGVPQPPLCCAGCSGIFTCPHPIEVSAYPRLRFHPLPSDSIRKEVAAWTSTDRAAPLLNCSEGGLCHLLGTLGSRRPSSQPFSRTYLRAPSSFIAAILHSRLSSCRGLFLRAADRLSFLMQPALRGTEATRRCFWTKVCT